MTQAWYLIIVLMNYPSDVRDMRLNKPVIYNIEFDSQKSCQDAKYRISPILWFGTTNSDGLAFTNQIFCTQK